MHTRRTPLLPTGRRAAPTALAALVALVALPAAARAEDAPAGDRMIDGKGIVPGDAIVALPSSGLHTNGYSLARKIVFEHLGLKVT